MSHLTAGVLWCHHARSDAHWHQLLEEKFAGVRHPDQWDLKITHTYVITDKVWFHIHWSWYQWSFTDWFYIWIRYLSLVAAATTLVCVCACVGDGHQSTQITHVNLIWIWSFKQTFFEELSCAMSNLTVTFHLAKTQTAIAVRHTGQSDINQMDWSNKSEVCLTVTVPPSVVCWESEPGRGPLSGSCRLPCVSDVDNKLDRWRSEKLAFSPWSHYREPNRRSIYQ